MRLPSVLLANKLALSIKEQTESILGLAFTGTQFSLFGSEAPKATKEWLWLCSSEALLPKAGSRLEAGLLIPGL